MWARVFATFGLTLLLSFLQPIASVGAVVFQLTGQSVPAGTALQDELSQHEGDPASDPLALDAQLDANRWPQTFHPPPVGAGVLVTFTLLQEDALLQSSFGWYNAGDPTRLFRIFACGDAPDATSLVDFDAELVAGRWDGGRVAFYWITPEDNAGSSCGDATPVELLGHSYFTESALVGDGNWVHSLVYGSKRDPQRFYLALENLYRSPNDDFADAAVRLEFLADGDAVELCDGVDNDGDGLIDEDGTGSPLNAVCYPPGSGANTGCTFDGTDWRCVGACRVGQRSCSGGRELGRLLGCRNAPIGGLRRYGQ